MFCEKPWGQGDVAVCIGHVTADLVASLIFVHRECVLREVAGDELADHYIARMKGPGN